jgi:hypothetical protein
VFTTFSLDGALAQQLLAAGEGIKQLLVKIVAVSQHHDGGVAHGRFQHQLAGIKDHREALTAALGMPDHSTTLISLLLVMHAG